jgi:ATP-dependent Clp protease, protease subunit
MKQQERLRKDFMSFARDCKLPTTTVEGYAKYALSGPTSVSSRLSTSIVDFDMPANAGVMDVFTRLMADRILYLGTEIHSDVMNVINAQLMFMDSISNEPIKMYINSPGGEIYSGLATYDVIQCLETPIYTCVAGLAASMGFILAIAGEKGHRYALPNSRLMQHQPMGGTWGQATDVELYMKEMNFVKKQLYNIIVDHTGQKYKKVEKDCDRDDWMSPIDAVKYGAIDKVVRKFSDIKQEEEEIDQLNAEIDHLNAEINEALANANLTEEEE